MNKLAFGVIGAGGIARRRTIPDGILPSSSASLVAVFDPVGCSEIASAFGVVACESEADLLSQAIDAVYVATPVHLHAGQVRMAARAGKHVLCEKPLGLSSAEARDMVAECARANVALGIGLFMRFHPLHGRAREIISSGELGTVVSARAQLSCWYPPIPGAWRQDPKLSGGGALIDLGCHCMDLLEFLLGPISRVCCTTANLVHPYPVEDSSVVQCQLASGALATVDCFFNIPDESSLNRLEIYGTRGSLLLEGTIGQGSGGSLQHRPAAQSGYNAAQVRAGSGARTIDVERVSPYRLQVEAFSDAILAGNPVPVGPAEGLRCQRLLDACYQSSREKAWMTV